MNTLGTVCRSLEGHGGINRSRFINITIGNRLAACTRGLFDTRCEDRLVEEVQAFGKGNTDAGRKAAAIIANARAGEDAKLIGFSEERGERIKGLLTNEQGYQLQHLVTQALNDSFPGWNSVGFKIGATGKAIQQKLGLNEPFHGELYRASTLVCVGDESNPQTNDNDIPLPVVNSRGIESEWGFVFKTSIPVPKDGKTISRKELESCIEFTFPCIEVTATRFATPAGTPLFFADGAGNGTVLVGKRSLWRSPDNLECQGAAEMNVKTFFDNELVGEGTGQNVLGHPLESLTWFVNQKNRREILKGDLVISGTANGNIPLEPKDLPKNVRVEFDGWGELDVDMKNVVANENKCKFIPFPC